MKILKTPDIQWSKKHICANCTAELEIEKYDVNFTAYLGDMRDPSYDTWTASCPVCSVTIHIDAADIPKAVQVDIKKKLAYGGPMDR